MNQICRLYAKLTFYVHQRAELDFGWIVVLPVDRCRPEDKVEQRTVKDLFDLVPLPSLRSEDGFVWLRPCHRRRMGRERPRWLGEANERLLEHGTQKGQRASEIRTRSSAYRSCIVMGQSEPGIFDVGCA
jgi:hypothetical protein